MRENWFGAQKPVSVKAINVKKLINVRDQIINEGEMDPLFSAINSQQHIINWCRVGWRERERVREREREGRGKNTMVVYIYLYLQKLVMKMEVII